MATIRSPKGLALTVLATLTIVVLAIGWLERGSNPELAEQAALLRIPTMALLTVAAGAGAWTVLALASYWIRISPVIILGSFLVGVPPTYDSYENWSWSSWPSNTFEAETLTSISREGPTGGVARHHRRRVVLPRTKPTIHP